MAVAAPNEKYLRQTREPGQFHVALPRIVIFTYQGASHDSHLRFWPGGGGDSLKRSPVGSFFPSAKKLPLSALPRIFIFRILPNETLPSHLCIVQWNGYFYHRRCLCRLDFDSIRTLDRTMDRSREELRVFGRPQKKK